MQAMQPQSAGTTPTLAVLESLASVDHLTITEIRRRIGAESWPVGKLGRTLDNLRERGLIVPVETDTYALTIAGRREVGRG